MIKNNEKGSTLVIVLLIVALITILGMSLFAMNISASKQFTTKEKQVQARHLAEMGVMHYQSKVEEDVDVFTSNKSNYEVYDLVTNRDNSTRKVLNIEKTKEKYIRGICQIVHIDDEHSIGHVLNTGEYKVKRTTDINCSNLTSKTEEIQVSIESMGIADSVEKTIEATIRVAPLSDHPNEENEGDKDPEPNPNFPEIPQPPTEDVDKRDSVDMARREREIVNQNLYITGGVNIEQGGGNEPNLLHVKKNLFVNKDMAFHNHACIVVDGDLTVLGNITIKNKQNSFVIVFGNAYLGGNLEDRSPEVIYVKGKVNSNSGTNVKSHSDLRDDWKTICGVTEEPNESEINELIWKVKPDVNPNYFPD